MNAHSGKVTSGGGLMVSVCKDICPTLRYCVIGFVLLIASVCIGGCVQGNRADRSMPEQAAVDDASLVGMSTSGTVRHDDAGRLIAGNLQHRYDDAAPDCGDIRRPSFLCSGVILRTARYVEGTHMWDAKVVNPKPGGMSFSWLRHDAQFGSVAHGYGQGFIVLPKAMYGDHPYQSMEVLCAFPIDAMTDRRGDRGCGAHVDFPDASVACQAQGIRTASAWFFHYDSVPGGQARHDHQCGFAMQADDAGSAAVFAAVPAIMRRMGKESFDEHNELVIAAWPAHTNETMPLEAFFYVEGTDGLAQARLAQADFLRAASIWRPVVALTLATSVGGRAQFAYHPADQGVR